MEPEVESSGTSRQARLRSAALFAGAFLLPPVLIVVLWLGTGEGFERAFESLDSVPVIGAVTGFFYKVISCIYFPPFLVLGHVNWALTPVGLYLILAAVYLIRRRWVYGAVLLVVPIVCTWILSAKLLGG